jgi:hypothetical protein
MRDRRPIRTARRKIRQDERERLGLAATPCVLCIQKHHVVGQKHDSQLTVPLCEMHHRAIHERLLRAGVSLRYERDLVKRVAMELRAMAVYRRAVADCGRAEADAMDRMADSLDESRDQPT